ncbi:transcription factor HHO1 [Cryptomeria japonica]|uniref:transcription factor HHO1 n=1 Tax=Cryptomeria japonica TaxID=3369 RepID=UPI0027DA3CFB|nr:transcription factor HHO1 [Cryptomeria japonica]
MGMPGELTLNYGPSTASASSALKAISLMGDDKERVRKHEEYIKRLEEERSKIEAFKRELPFCMQLVNDAIEASKRQLADCQHSSHDEGQQESPDTNGRPVLEEFIPIRKKIGTTDEKSNETHAKKPRLMNGDKPHWMISAQLWNPDPHSVDSTNVKPVYVEESLKEQNSRRIQSVTSNTKLFSDSKQRVGGAFQPFSKERKVISPVPIRSTLQRTLPDLGLSPAEHKHDVGSSLTDNENKCLNATAKTRSRSRESTELPRQVQGKEATAVSNAVNTPPTTSAGNPPQSQAQRKSRRCWSAELHKRFVNALQQLGGSQVATPKQIRELMKVDGLTNDEVKSHLQKYRLHTRRPSPPQSTNAQAPQLVVLGGIWVPPEYAAHASAATQQGQSHYSPLSTTAASPSQPHYCQASIPYSQINSSASQFHLQQSLYCNLQHQQTSSHSHSSPQGSLQCNGQLSEARGTSVEGGGREESVGEDGKSNSSSWREEEYAETTGRS